MSALSEQRAAGASATESGAAVPAPSDDAALLRAAQEGSRDAVEALVRRHWDAAHRAAYLVIQDAGGAEDIAQEALLAAVDRIGDFDRRRPFGPWLHRIVVNRAIDWARARGRRAEVGADVFDRLEPVDARREARALPDDLVAALATLDAEDRAVVVLRHLLDYSSSEIARMLGVPPATVRTRLRRALERVRPLLEDRRRERS